MLDITEPYDAHIDRRLRTEPIIWITTSSPSGLPHMAPMWFLWDGCAILLFSLPKTRKLRDIAANSAVVLALEAADQGYDVVIIEGQATLINEPSITGLMPAFVEKYAGVPRRWPPQEWAKKFSQAIPCRSQTAHSLENQAGLAPPTIDRSGSAGYTKRSGEHLKKRRKALGLLQHEAAPTWASPGCLCRRQNCARWPPDFGPSWCS